MNYENYGRAYGMQSADLVIQSDTRSDAVAALQSIDRAIEQSEHEASAWVARKNFDRLWSLSSDEILAALSHQRTNGQCVVTAVNSSSALTLSGDRIVADLRLGYCC